MVATCAAGVRYVQALHGQCDDSSNNAGWITTADECQAAAVGIGRVYGGSIDQSRFPHVCFYSATLRSAPARFNERRSDKLCGFRNAACYCSCATSHTADSAARRTAAPHLRSRRERSHRSHIQDKKGAHGSHTRNQAEIPSACTLAEDILTILLLCARGLRVDLSPKSQLRTRTCSSCAGRARFKGTTRPGEYRFVRSRNNGPICANGMPALSREATGGL